MISEIDKLKHFYAENYSDTNFTDDLMMVKNFFILQLGVKMIKK